MKKKIFIITLLFSCKLFSQFSSEFETEKESFQYLSKPSITSELSTYLKEKLTQKDLKKISHLNIKSSLSKKEKNEYDGTIRLSFYINKKNKSWFAKINTGDKKLDKKITSIFYKFPIDKIIAENKKNLSDKYIVQLFSKIDKKNIINASQFAVRETMPRVGNCDKTKYERFRNSCFYNNLNNIFSQNFSKELKYKYQKKREIIIIKLQFTIDRNGNITNTKSNSFDKKIDAEALRILNKLGKVNYPALRNGKPCEFQYETSIIIII